MYQLHLAGGHCPLRGLDAPCARWKLYEIRITLVNTKVRPCVLDELLLLFLADGALDLFMSSPKCTGDETVSKNIPH